MKDSLPDNTIILIILCTLLIVFSFIFMFRPSSYQIEDSIEWRDSYNRDLNQMEFKGSETMM